MQPLTEREVRSSFVNCSQGQAKRLPMPRGGLAEQPWDDLDFLGWRDPDAGEGAYLVAPTASGPVGLLMRAARPSGALRRSLCAVCLTTHPGDGVCLMTAPLAGAAGRQGDSVGLYFCADLACSLYLRGKKDAGMRFAESIPLEEKIERAVTALDAFVARVLAR